MKTLFTTDLFGKSGVTVSTDGEVYKLTWTDYVANDWSEQYSDLAVVFARIAVLTECIESEASFADGTAEDFAPKATKFIYENVEDLVGA